MACKYMYLTPLFIAVIIHQIIFSPHFIQVKSSTFLLYPRSDDLMAKDHAETEI